MVASGASSRWLVAMRCNGEAWKLFKVHVTGKNDYYVLLLHSNPPKGFGRLDRHVSHHRSGQRHFTGKDRGRRHPGAAETVSVGQPTSALKGIEVLLPGAPLMKGQFSALEPLREGSKNVILLDADLAGFRDDYLVLRVFLVEPHQEKLIPVPVNPGPRVLHSATTVRPWIAIEAYPEAIG